MGHVTDLTPRTQLIDAVGGTAVFAYNFLLTDQADLVVEQTDALTGVVTTLLLTTDYTVAGIGVSSGGTITLVTPALINDIITMERDIPIERLNDYPTQGDFAADTVNAEQDEIYMIAQQQERDIQRSMRLQTADEATDLLLPLSSDRASRYLAFNSNGDIVMLEGTTSVPSEIKSILPGGGVTGENIPFNSATIYHVVGTQGFGGLVNEALVQSFIAPVGGQVGNLYVQLGVNSLDGDCVFTIRDDAADTAVTLTLAAGVLSGNSGALFAEIAAGSLLTLSINPSGTAGLISDPDFSFTISV